MSSSTTTLCRMRCWRWFIAIYVVSGIGGALASAMLNPVDALSVGASGAIVGLLGSAMVLSLHAASYDRRKKIWVMCFRVGVPALLPTASVTAHHIDYSAHTGGAMVGMALGYLLLIAWNGARTRPPWQIAAGAAGGILGLVSLGALEVAALLPSAAAAPKVTAGLLPSDQMPSSVAEAARLSPILESQFPQDPRVRAFAAQRWKSSGDIPEAILELQQGLQSPLLKAPEVDPALEIQMRTMLIGLDIKTGDYADAKIAAAPLCASPTGVDPKMMAALNRSHWCG